MGKEDGMREERVVEMAWRRDLSRRLVVSWGV